MKQKFNVGDKVEYDGHNSDETEIAEVTEVHHMYTIKGKYMRGMVSEKFLSEYVPDLSGATVDDLVKELQDRGFDEVELKKRTPFGWI